MKYEMKICLPPRKITCSVCFAVLLSLIRGVTEVCEIGIVLDPYMAVLAIVFCADAWQMEYTGRRWEIFGLYPLKSRLRALLKRLAIQCLYLLFLSVPAYFCFFWQRPRIFGEVSGFTLFALSLAAVFVSVFFWGTLAFTLANLCRNTLAGIGISIAAWLFANSAAGMRILGNFSVFAFAFRDTDKSADFGWVLGKVCGMLGTVFLASLLPRIMRKRG